MLQRTRAALQSALGDLGDWERLKGQVVFESFSPNAIVRAAGDPVQDVLVVECGLFELLSPGRPSQWAPAGAVLGIAASVTGAGSSTTVTAQRHSRIARVPAEALWSLQGDVRSSLSRLARLVQLPDYALATLPPDPLIITALLEGCDAELESTIIANLRDAVDGLNGWQLVDIATTAASTLPTLADELASHESGAQTVVYVVRDAEGARAAEIVDHADRVLIFQSSGAPNSRSAALAVAGDNSPRRHTELVLVRTTHTANTTATQRIQIPARVRRLHQLPDPSPVQLEALLIEMRANARDHVALREFNVFRDLSDEELAWVQAALRWERLDGGAIVHHQGDKADDVWLLRAGRLEEIRTLGSGERRVSLRVPGEMVGASSLLTNGKHATTIRAVRDSTVARMDRPTFDALMARSSGFSSAVARQAATQTTGRPVERAHRARIFAVVPITASDRMTATIAALAAVYEELGIEATVVDTARLDATLGPKASVTRRGETGDGEIIAWLDRLDREYDAIILVCSGTFDTWTRRAIRQCNALLFVGDGTAAPELHPIERALSDPALGFTGAAHLLLLQPAGLAEARGTGEWLARRPGYTHHHVRTNNHGDVERLARRLSGNALALALSGASSRAPAHLGVVRAMEDYGMPIDIVSGSSSGAGAAALLAAGIRGEEALAKAISIITTGAPNLLQFQPPITALTSGAAADRSLQVVFGDRQLEDQWIPAVLTAVDIRRHRAVHLSRGPIWKLVRASCSLPLVWPPVWHEDDLLVDGGIINYLPVDVFGDQADEGLIIASNLDASAGQGAPAFEGSRNYGTHMNSWGELARRIGRSKAPQPAGMIDILFHTMAIPSFQQQEGLAALAEQDNVRILTPPLAEFGLFAVNGDTSRVLEHTAWKHALQELSSVAALWHARTRWRVPAAVDPVS